MHILSRNELRKRITNHPRWDEIKVRDGLASDKLDVATLRRLAAELGIHADAPSEIEAPSEDDDTPASDTPEQVTSVNPKPVTPAPASPSGLTEAEAAILDAVRNANKAAAELAARNAAVSEARIVELINLHSAKPTQIILDIKAGELPVYSGEGLYHYKFPLVLSALASGLNVMLVGPAGSGKTTLGEQCAKAMNLNFYFNGAIASEYKLSGFIDAQGRIISTAFRKAFELGGVYLFDEIDASMPGALLAFNAALANGHADFPDGMVKRHPDFRCIAAANTFGSGSSRVYVGRNQLDAASTDRFVTLDLDYDIALEAALLGCPRPAGAKRPVTIEPRTQGELEIEMPLALARIRRLRDRIADLNDVKGRAGETIRHVISPRASMAYAKLYAAGWPKDEIDNSVIWKGCDMATRAKIEGSN